jgi:hypothetical protein
VALRPNPDPEVVPLLKAIKARIEGLGQVTSTPKDGADVYYRNKTPFLQLEIRRDHMSLDLWLSGTTLDEARASGIARAHPFLGDEAVKVRFERAEDLSRVARWIEASYTYAPERGKKGGGKKSTTKPVVKTTPLIKSIATPPANTASGTSMPASASTPKNGAALASATPATPAAPPTSVKPTAPSKPVKAARAKKSAASRTQKATKKRAAAKARRPSRAKKAAKKAAPKKRTAKRSRR